MLQSTLRTVTSLSLSLRPRLLRGIDSPSRTCLRGFHLHSHGRGFPSVAKASFGTRSTLCSPASSSFRRLPVFPRQARHYSVVPHQWRGTGRILDARFFSANSSRLDAPTASDLPILSPPAVGRWLLLSSALVFAIVIVGGVTRLTESGLSITEWRPITGILPPMSQAEWDEEFQKYKGTPEFKL